MPGKNRHLDPFSNTNIIPESAFLALIGGLPGLPWLFENKSFMQFQNSSDIIFFTRAPFFSSVASIAIFGALVLNILAQINIRIGS
jgi:hypothetical protein